MKSLIVKIDDDKNFEFMKLLVQKLGYKVQELTEEETEDLGLLKSMVGEKRGDYASEKQIRKALKKK
jgi:hypothetical protein